jgi:nitroreductase
MEPTVSTPLIAPEAIARRRATRHFDSSRPLPDDLLKRILHLATLAPSSFNLQPWRFLVVRTLANRQRLRACAYNQPKITEAPVAVVVLGYHFPEKSHLPTIVDMMRETGQLTPELAAELTARTTDAMARVPDRPFWTMRSTMPAAATLMIAAESLGVASSPMEGFEPAKVKETFGIPDDHTVCCLVALGFAAKGQPFPGRLGLEEVCFEEHFGQPWTLGDV